MLYTLTIQGTASTREIFEYAKEEAERDLRDSVAMSTGPLSEWGITTEDDAVKITCDAALPLALIVEHFCDRVEFQRIEITAKEG
ncbi:hypothetical protein AB0M39_41390 [Streptomyces sp. NPDC051907]|uniref:hypothetical protein n=1 Tax=Streptomyces sp. NPDC051907 TaxID=3155284 RepID=UPI003449A42D